MLIVNIIFAKYSEIQNSLVQSDEKTHFLFEYYLLSWFYYEETNDGYAFLYLFRLLVGRIIHISQRIVAVNSIRVIIETKGIRKQWKTGQRYLN